MTVGLVIVGLMNIGLFSVGLVIVGLVNATPTKLFLSQLGIGNIDATLLHDPDHNQRSMFVKEEESVGISFFACKK